MIILVIVTVGASAKKKTVTQINDYLEQGDFDSAMVLIQKIDVDDKSYDTALYEAAQNLLKEGDFEHASLITERIVDTNNLDITPLNDEITYQRIQALLDQGDEQAAEPLIENIKNEDQYDKQSLYSDVAAIRIKREFSDLNIVDAIVDLIHLKDTDAERAADLIDSYAEDIYQYGVSQYHENILDESETVFSLLDPEYQRTKDYLLLMQITRIIKLELLDWDWDDKDDPERVLAQELVKIADFENAGEILMTNQKIAVLFFDGGWTGGSKHFFITPRGKRVSTSILDKLDKKNVEYYDQSWNIPGLSSEYCSISKGEFYQRADNRLFTISKKIARFTVIDANTISIYVYSSGTSYTLNRDFPLH
ncbi:hypothetical protein SDC9_122436 [bioreactor metagenome]|uniref:Uncharacterized protein n=1 Tax=bioreactor metagenome TaxID=1076179 RepID=A0A645CEW4_9ZZZZ